MLLDAAPSLTDQRLAALDKWAATAAGKVQRSSQLTAAELTGARAEITIMLRASDAEAFRRVRSRVAADADGCRMATCGRARECFWVRARRRAAEAKLVIVNHALLALGGDADGPLPDGAVVALNPRRPPTPLPGMLRINPYLPKLAMAS